MPERLAVFVMAATAVLAIGCARGETTEPNVGRATLDRPQRSPTPAETVPARPGAGTEEDSGQALYARLGCPGCHEYAAVPGLIVLPLTNLHARYTQETLVRYLLAPPPAMPNFGLSGEQAGALAAYLLREFG